MTDQVVIGVPLATRLQRIIRHKDKWQLWLATRDYQYGTYLLLWDDGLVESVTERENEGPSTFVVKPLDTDKLKGEFW